jgi:predicted nucleic acid-binding protein
VRLVLDTSGWNRHRHPSVAPRWRATLAAGLFAICPVVALELLAASRDEDAFHGLDKSLSPLPQAPVTRTACERAISASRELTGERRLPAADYLIAAAAAERGFGVLHYDRHFDPLCLVLGIEGVLVGSR